MKSKDKLIAKGSIVVKKNDTESSSSSSDSDLKDAGLKTNQFLNKPETSIYKNVPLDNKIDFSGQNQSIENLKVPNKKMISNSSSDSDSSSEEENADINKSVSLTGDALKTNACKGVIGSSTVQNLSNSVKSAMTPQKSKDQKTPGKSSSQKLTAPSTGVTTPKSKFATSAALGSTKNLDASSTSDDSSDSDTDSDDRKGKNSNFDADLNKITTKKNPNLSFKATNVSNLSQTPDKPSTILKSQKETPPIIPQLPVNTKESDSSDSDSSSDPKRIKTVIKTFKPADSKPASKTAVNKIASNSFVASQNKKSEPGKSTTLAASSKSLQESVDVSSDSDSSSDTQDGENGKPSPIVQSKKTPTAFKTPASASKLAENKKAEVVPDKKSKISKNSKISKSVSVPQKNSKKLINQPEGDPAPAPQKSQSVLFDTSTGSEDDSKSIGIGESDKKGSVPSKKFKPSVKGGKTEIGAKGQVSVSKTKPLPPGVAVNNEVLGSSSSDSSDEGSEGDQVNNRESNISKSSKTEPTKLEKSSNKTNQDVLTNGGDDTSAIGKPKKRKKGADDTATQDFEPKTDKPSFRRINNNINELPEELRTNEFQPTTSNASGIHASKAFKNVQGKDFKREKGKRKRGSFTLGTIDTSARSFKFNDNE
ncbi:hypothetical protein RF11_09249 [Thelohanellus kitauei]|uniref:Srp40 C-terminal domain-containing protein n=1 Tax=Thelohanellus kitauei TaxID=669202 RepID=A0A0C2MKC3_THEKT|nr:hypothetical protein RF11_09249 [Thelohanellus kitauei]